VIIAFYFGGRMQLKRQDMTVIGCVLNVAREILALRHGEEAHGELAPRPLAALPPDGPDGPAVVGAAGGNRVVEAWRRRQMAAGQR
jgi:hypothetical protein